MNVGDGLPMDKRSERSVCRWTWMRGCCDLPTRSVSPAWEKLEPTLWHWGDADLDGLLHGCLTVVWHHDESTYYANDQCNIWWVHQGEGVSLMVGDFVLADYGWLCPLDGSQQAWVLFKTGKAQFQFDSNSILNMSPALQVLFLIIVLVMQLFKTTYWIPNWNNNTILDSDFQSMMLAIFNVFLERTSFLWDLMLT